jgi:microsomal dipeptidase-like Zn-dependent dipeptidase
MICFINFTLA